MNDFDDIQCEDVYHDGITLDDINSELAIAGAELQAERFGEEIEELAIWLASVPF